MTPPTVAAGALEPVVGVARRNSHGRARAITVMGPIRPWLILWLRGFFWSGRTFPIVTKTLRRLSFIHFARWSIIDELPHNGPPSPRERLNYRYLLFESNFNGMWDQYIDAFSHLLRYRMTGIWGCIYGFPGALPVGPFKEYIRASEYIASHFYSAYPEATTTVVLSALHLDARFADFATRVKDVSPEEFARKWRRFLTETQHCL